MHSSGTIVVGAASRRQPFPFEKGPVAGLKLTTRQNRALLSGELWARRFDNTLKVISTKKPFFQKTY
jgi:hypothetical protein